MFRAHRPIFTRVRTALHTTIGSVSVLLCSRALYVVACLSDYSKLSRVLAGPHVASFHTLKTITFILNIPVHVRAVCMSRVTTVCMSRVTTVCHA